MKKLLSTKLLSPSQRDLITAAGISVVNYDAVAAKPLEFDMPKNIGKVILTSQNGVEQLANRLGSLAELGDIYCVGEKTASYCRELGGNVRFFAENGQKLAEFVIKNHKNDHFTYFCSARRRDELPELLKTAKIDLFEVKTYDIAQDLRVFNQKWDGILFFSPSGLEAYFKHNDPGKAGTLFCIGPTTANQAIKYAPNVLTSNSPTTESLIAKAVKTLNNA